MNGDEMNNRGYTIALWVVSILLVGLCISVFIVSSKKPNFSWIDFLSGSATVAIAILTIVYVATTRGQLEVMSRQLDEMKKDRELQNQPLPWPTKMGAKSESPRFFFAPPADYGVLPRQHINFELTNIGTSAAVSIHISCALILPRNGKHETLKATAVHIDVLGENRIYPSTEKELEEFMYPDDDGKVLERLLDNSINNYPLCKIRIYYRNILGACFKLQRLYRIYPPTNGDPEKIKSWLERIKTFPIRNKELVEELRSKLPDRDPILFEELRGKCAEGLDEADIEFRIWPIPTGSEVSCISVSEYDEAIKELSYSVFMG